MQNDGGRKTGRFQTVPANPISLMNMKFGRQRIGKEPARIPGESGRYRNERPWGKFLPHPHENLFPLPVNTTTIIEHILSRSPPGFKMGREGPQLPSWKRKLEPTRIRFSHPWIKTEDLLLDQFPSRSPARMCVAESPSSGSQMVLLRYTHSPAPGKSAINSACPLPSMSAAVI